MRDQKQDIELLTTGEVAEEFRLSRSMLCKRRIAGERPKFVKLGRKILYRRTDVTAWIEGELHVSTSEYSSPIRVDGTPKRRRGRPPRTQQAKGEAVRAAPAASEMEETARRRGDRPAAQPPPAE